MLTTSPQPPCYSTIDCRLATFICPNICSLKTEQKESLQLVTYYQGPARARHLSALLPAGLEPEEIVAILLGGFPLLPYEDFSFRYDAREELWFLDLKSSSGGERQILGIDPKSGQILSAEYPLQGLTRRLSFSEFKLASNFSFPHRIHFESPGARAQFTVEYQEIAPNPEWEEQDFYLPVPRGAQIVPLE
ncbi:MAG: hypothetical protein H6Q72_485 [Firmicutes bacterium]|nr:hypothetical protein [Bacillota bacterium]